MENSEVIAMRNALKGGKNFPLRIWINCNHTCIDESNRAAVVKWDDTNGVLYIIRLPDEQSNQYNTNLAKCVQVFAVNYYTIEAMESSVLHLEDLPKVLESMQASGCELKDDFKQLIIDKFTLLLSDDVDRLTRQGINEVNKAGYKSTVDYYNGVYPEPFQETVALNRRNEEAKRLYEKYNKKD